VPSIGEIACEPEEEVAYHVHAHLSLRARLTVLPIPAGIGVLPTCLYWLHTHDARGIIHVEAPSSGRFSLGQFFDVWHQPLTPDRVATTDVGTSDRIFTFVDGVAWTGDPRAIELRDHAVIDLQVDIEPRSPFEFDFPPGT